MPAAWDRAMSPNTKKLVSRALGWNEAGSIRFTPGNQAADVVHAVARLGRRRERFQQWRRLAARALHEHGHAGAQQIGQAFGG